MRAALLLSVAFVICGIAALIGVPAIYAFHKPVLGVFGLAASLVYAAIPPLVVLSWRKIKSRSMGRGANDDVPPNTSPERTRDR